MESTCKIIIEKTVKTHGGTATDTFINTSPITGCFIKSDFPLKVTILTVSHLAVQKVGCEATAQDGTERKGLITQIKYKIIPYLDKRHFYEAKILLNFYDADIMLLEAEIPRTLFRTAKIGDPEKLRIGETVYLAGNPESYDWTYEKGFIVFLHRKLGWHISDMIQTSIRTNDGNSGGPLFDEKGLLVGCSSCKSSGGNFSFATPISLIPKPPYDHVKSEIWMPALPFETLSSPPITDGKNQNTPLADNGALVIKLVPENKSLEIGDVITEVDDKKVNDEMDIRLMIVHKKAGESVSVKLKRLVNGKIIDLKTKVTLLDRTGP